MKGCSRVLAVERDPEFIGSRLEHRAPGEEWDGCATGSVRSHGAQPTGGE